MSIPPILIPAGALAALYVAAGEGAAPAVPAPSPVKLNATALVGGRLVSVSTAPKLWGVPFISPKVGSPGSSTAAASSDVRGKLEERARAEYAKLGASAKAAAAAKLSAELGIKPPLTGKETWDEISRKAGAAAGAAACTAAGLAVAGPLCAQIGAYFGGKLDDWVADAYGAVAAGVTRAGKAVANAAEDAAKEVGGAAKDAWNAVTGWI